MAETLTPAQIASYAAAAGFSGQSLVTAIAVALAESGGVADVVGDTTLSHASYGLWQINAIHDTEPAIAALGGAEACVDPTKCAEAAWIVSSQGVNWQPWSTFKNGAYREHLAPAIQAAAALPASAPSPASTPIAPMSPATSGISTSPASTDRRLAFAVAILGRIAGLAGGDEAALALEAAAIAQTALDALRDLG